MANLRTNNLSGEQGQNAYRGSVQFVRGGSTGPSAGVPNDYLVFPAITIGTSDFTIEGWLYKTISSDYPVIIDTRESGNGDTGGFFFGTDSDSYLYFYTQSTSAIKQTILANNAWYHFALVKTGGTTTLYLNGQVSGTYSDSNDYSNTLKKIGTSQQHYDGVQNNWNWPGYLSNIRIVVGSAVYTSAFTPPTGELKAIPNTKLLCCQNSNDPTQEGTGRGLTAAGGSFQTGNNSILANSDFSEGTLHFQGDSGASISESGGVMTVTNGGGDNTFALKQKNVLKVGGKYRCTATVTPTFASGDPVFRVRFGGSSESFVQPQATMSTGVAFRIDTGEKVADGRHFEIGSGSSSGITQFTITDLVVTAIDPPTAPKVIPPVGRDAGNTFGGIIQQSSQGYMYFPTGRTEERVIVNNNFGTRGLVFQGLKYDPAPSSTYLNTIEFITVATKGNATDFGDLISKANAGAGAGNLTRGIQVSGNDPSGATNVIQFVTIATTGNAQDFGDVGYLRCNSGAVSNQTRLVYSGGESPVSPNPRLNNIEFITFATTGNGVDFGDQMTLVNSPYGVSSPTRGVFMGGSGATPTIQSIEIATTGDSILFGDLTSALYNVRGTITNGHRGVMAGGVISPTGRVNNIDYITIQSGGKSIDFGDLTDARDPSNLSSMTRGVMLSGDYPANVNIMDFIEIMTTGNAVDFGDCNKSSGSSTASNGHGGLADAL